MLRNEKVPIGTFWWAVTDASEAVQALVIGCRHLKDARRIAASFLPEFTDLQCIAWANASTLQRRAALQSPHITPAMCKRLEIEPPPNQLPQPPSIDKHVKRLQKHFAHAVGGLR